MIKDDQGANVAPGGAPLAVPQAPLEAPAPVGPPVPPAPAEGPSPAVKTLDAARAAAEAPQNDYDQIIQSDRQWAEAGTKASFYVSRDQDPDRSAKVLNLAKDLGVAPDVVDRNYDQLSKSR